jgi:hypothetical protein
MKALFLGVVLLSTASQAGECLLRATRTPVPGKEVEALAPFMGRNPSNDLKQAANRVLCQALALETCIKRDKNLVKEIVVNAKFDGEDVKDGKDLCQP